MMDNALLVTGYFHAAYIIAGAIYLLYIVSLSARARRAAARANESQQT